MGRRITQVIHVCDKCGEVPEHGERMWEMGSEIWCQKCADE